MTENEERQPLTAEHAEERGQGICRTCLAPIWNEGGTVGHVQRDTGWSDRIKQGGDSLVCFKAIDYRHVPLEGREAAIYDRALIRTPADSSRDALKRRDADVWDACLDAIEQNELNTIQAREGNPYRAGADQ
ncbi:hypothetical protein [Herbiconiux sp. UC225_62]|uniref:hypothetical protein n=1 Tax=Herbiconiux sp. UC225_62 TaxID=3350168 RepID=UPI0036D2095A